MAWPAATAAVAVVEALVWLWLGPLSGEDPQTPLDDPDASFEAFRSGSHREWGP